MGITELAHFVFPFPTGKPLDTSGHGERCPPRAGRMVRHVEAYTSLKTTPIATSATFEFGGIFHLLRRPAHHRAEAHRRHGRRRTPLVLATCRFRCQCLSEIKKLSEQRLLFSVFGIGVIAITTRSVTLGFLPVARFIGIS